MLYVLVGFCQLLFLTCFKAPEAIGSISDLLSEALKRAGVSLTPGSKNSEKDNLAAGGAIADAIQRIVAELKKPKAGPGAGVEAGAGRGPKGRKNRNKTTSTVSTTSTEAATTATEATATQTEVAATETAAPTASATEDIPPATETPSGGVADDLPQRRSLRFMRMSF